MDSGRNDWLPPAGITSSGRPELLPGEVERFLLPSADLEAEESPSLPALRSCLVILTSHRLIFLHEPSRSARALPLNSVVHSFPLKKSIKSLFQSHPKIRVQISMPVNGVNRMEVVTVVMRGRSDADGFYGKLLEVLRARAWEVVAEERGGGRSSSSGLGAGSSRDGDNRVRMPFVGVSGILRKEQEMWENTDKSLHDAFQDLNALMSKAKEMVLLAEKMRQKLLSGPSSQAHVGEEDMSSNQEMQDWLLSVGIVSPVTKESAGALYHQQLARQLADFVKLPVEKAGGMVALIDIYCLFNRARGTELISPEDMLQACAIWEKIDVPVMLRRFDSGVMVIQSKTHNDDEVFARIASLAQKPDALRSGLSPTDASLALGIAPALAKEHMLSAESKGILCRDVSPDGFRFFVNIFSDIHLDNIHSFPTSGLFAAWVSAASIPT